MKALCAPAYAPTEVFPVKREDGVFPSHAGAVVAHQHQGLASLLQLHPHVPGTRVQRVLHQLLHHRGGTLDDLAGGDLVDELLGEDPDRHGAGRITENGDTREVLSARCSGLKIG